VARCHWSRKYQLRKAADNLHSALDVQRPPVTAGRSRAAHGMQPWMWSLHVRITPSLCTCAIINASTAVGSNYWVISGELFGLPSLEGTRAGAASRAHRVASTLLHIVRCSHFVVTHFQVSHAQELWPPLLQPFFLSPDPNYRCASRLSQICSIFPRLQVTTSCLPATSV
jgi:hypothetical protein